jgi:hypothetical protein
MSALEMQALLEELARKQRELDRLTRPPPPRKRSWLPAALPFIALVAAIVGGICLVQAQRLDDRRTPGSLRAAVAHSPAIPWRHYVGVQADGRRCDIWLSVLGMAEIECDGKTVYRGFGRVDHDGSFRSVPVEDPEARDAGRAAVIDVRARRAHIGPFAVSGRLASGMIDLTELEDQSLVDDSPVGPEAPSPATTPSADSILRVVQAHRDDLADCADGHGKLTVRIDAAASGRVKGIVIHDSTVKSSVEKCLREAARSWKFPAADDGWSAEFPLVFAD